MEQVLCKVCNGNLPGWTDEDLIIHVFFVHLNTMARYEAGLGPLLLSYPAPNDNPACQCKGQPLKAFFCPFGHMAECHAPSKCAEARCSHLLNADALGLYAGAELMSADEWAATVIKWFRDEPDPGPDCICSLCHNPIYNPDTDPELAENSINYEPPLRFVHSDTGLEVRFHELCALRALPAIYAMTTAPVPADEQAAPS